MKWPTRVRHRRPILAEPTFDSLFELVERTSEKPQKVRLFAAVDAPRGHLEAIDEALGPLKEGLSGARWVAVGNQHLTVKFLGWTEAGLFDRIRAACEKIAAGSAPFELSFDRLGKFPGGRRARVVWIGVADPGGLASLAKSAERAFARLGFAREERPYSPHLTVCRLKTPRPLPEDLPEVPAEARAPFLVDRLVLYRSHLAPTGARYESVGSFALTG